MSNFHNLSFSSWPFPGPKCDFSNCKLSISKFGMIAYTSDNVISILAEEIDRYTPMLMWKPFRNSSTSLSSRITAIGWYDASCCFEVLLPVIVIASGGGNLIVYDIRSTKVIANFKRKNDYITTIKWSPFSTSTFFAGTSSGSFVRFEVDLSQVVTATVKWEIQFSEMQIDFITIDEIDGNRAAIASKNGNFGVIYNINSDKPFHSADCLTISEQSKKINNCSFFPVHRNFLIVTTNSESMLYALEEDVSVPLLNITGIQQIQVSRNLGNKVIVVRLGTIELWELQKDMSKRISSTKISSSKLTTMNEIQLVDILDDSIFILTSNFWLATIELRNNKLFVTKRVKLFDSKPNDFSFANDAFAFCTEDGKVLVTRTTSPKFKQLMRWKTPKTAAQAANSVNERDAKPKSDSKTGENSEQKESNEKNVENGEKKVGNDEKNVGNDEKNVENGEKNVGNDEKSVENGEKSVENEKSHNVKIEQQEKRSKKVEIGEPQNKIIDQQENHDEQKSKEDENKEDENKEDEIDDDDSVKARLKIRRHMTLDAISLKKTGGFKYLDNGSTDEGSSHGDSSNSNDVKSNSTCIKTSVRNKSKAARRYSISDIHAPSSDTFLNFRKQKTFDPLPEDDEIVSKSVIIRRGQSKNPPSFLDDANEDGSFTNVTTKLTDGSGSFELPSTGLVLGSSPSLLASSSNGLTKEGETELQPFPSIAKQPQEAQNSMFKKVSDQTESTYNNDAVSKIGSAMKNPAAKQSDISKHVKIAMPISKPPEKKRRLSSSIEEVNLSSNLIHFAKKTKLSAIKDASFSFDPSLTSMDASSSKKFNGEAPKSAQNNGKGSELAKDTKNVKEQIRTVKTQNMYGNNCSFLWSYQVSNSEYNHANTPTSMLPSDKKLNRVEWITGTRLIAWNQNKDFLMSLINESNSVDQDSDQPVKSYVSLKSRQGIVYVIDLKLHKVVPLLKKPGMSITDFSISKNKQLFAVTVNGFIVSIFLSSNSQGPSLLGTITFHNEVVVTFINDIVVMINIKKHTMTVTAPIDPKKPALENRGSRKLKIKSSYGLIVSAIGSSKGLFIGTSLGFILKVEAVTYNVVEILQMSSSVIQFKWTSPSSKDSSFLACDLSGSTVMLNDDGEFVNIKGKFENAIPISPAVIAGTPQPSTNGSVDTESGSNVDEKVNEHYFIEAVGVIGGAFRPKFPTVAVRNPLMKPRSKWAQSLTHDEPTVKDLPLYGIPLIAKLINAERNPYYCTQQTLLLRDLIMNTPELWHRAFRYSLLVKDNEAAKNILTSLPPSHPEFMKCLLKRALFGSSKYNMSFVFNSSSDSGFNVNELDNSDINESVESVKTAAKLMDSNGSVKDAVDILLISGLWVNACKLLVKRKLLINAITIARICSDKNTENNAYKPSNSLYMQVDQTESNMVIKELSDIILAKNVMPSYAATILCESGFIDDVISILNDVGESEQARVLSITE